jgi:hypothetical protein
VRRPQFRSLGIAAEFHLLENLRGISKAHRRHHGLAGALPASELAIDEHTALMNGCRRAMFEGNFLGPWKQLSQELGIDQDNSPDLGWFTSIRLRADRAGSSRATADIDKLVNSH